MQIQMVDNIERKTVSVLASAIDDAHDIRFAVAFVSDEGLDRIMPSLGSAIERKATLEFLIGMDSRATDPRAVFRLFEISRSNPNVSLLCFASPIPSAIYHPKIYLTRNGDQAMAMIGSSNLTSQGLSRNIEANLAVWDDVHSEVISEIYNTYGKLKYHPNRVVPDEEFISLFAEWSEQEKRKDRAKKKEASLAELKDRFLSKAKILQRPKPTKNDLFGWLELIYDTLPDGEFSNQDIYAFENLFSRQYPQNRNIRAKIRQQLQYLANLGFIEHVTRGIWRKVA